MPLTIDGQANSITSSVGGVNIPATVGTLSVGPSGSYMNVTSSGVGIGTLTPQTTLDVGGTIRNTPDKSSYIQVGRFSSAYGGAALSTAGGATFLSLQVEGFEGVKIDSAGRVTKPSQPYFFASRSGNQTNFDMRSASTSVVVYNTTSANVGNHYSTSTGLFTAPVSGMYAFSAAATTTVTSEEMWWIVNGTRTTTPLHQVSTTLGKAVDIVYLNANDTIGIHPYDSGDATNAAIEANIHHTYFKGYLIG